MNKKQKFVGVLVLMGCLAASTAFADEDHYHHRNIFNHFTDWCATFGKSRDEKQRIIDDRVSRRAEWRQAHGHHGHDDQR